MSFLEVLILLSFLAVVLLRLWLTGGLIAAFKRRQTVARDESQWPSVVAVMALRGGDEFLQETLNRLATMDYPSYRLRLVLDSSSDPARQIVERFLESARPENVDVLFLGDRPLTCSGKVAGLLKGSENLPAGCEVVAVFDGDAVVHPSCLRELVAPLMSGAGLTTGNRWYAPEAATMGGLARFIWNGCAVTVMNAVHIPWGGCMAIRADLISHPDLRSRLSKAFGEDSTIATFLLQRSETVQFVPEATIINREDSTVRGFYNFLVRQYLTVRLHNPKWKFVSGSNFLLGFLMIGANLYFLLGGSQYQTVFALGYLLVFLAISFELSAGCYLVRRQKALAGIHVPRFTVRHWVMTPVAMTLLNYLNMVACVHAQFIQRHEWRGITYRFPGTPTVEIVDVKSLDPTCVQQHAHGIPA
jgi:cellulose synthase/poly-beta-1,6-N-acetylglucosamine synthase-like glycosyltransferase